MSLRFPPPSPSLIPAFASLTLLNQSIYNKTIGFIWFSCKTYHSVAKTPCIIHNWSYQSSLYEPNTILEKIFYFHGKQIQCLLIIYRLMVIDSMIFVQYLPYARWFIGAVVAVMNRPGPCLHGSYILYVLVRKLDR